MSARFRFSTRGPGRSAAGLRSSATAVVLVCWMVVSSGCGDVSERLRLVAIATTYQQGEVETAVDELGEFLLLHPENSLAWTILGHAHNDLDHVAEARSAYEEALRIEPTKVEALTGIGILDRKAGDYETAMNHYSRAVEIDPEYAQAYSSMVTIGLKLHQDDKALTYAQKARALDRSDPVIAANLAIAYHYNDMPAERDAQARAASKLGYAKMDSLRSIFRGELTLRD